MEPAPVRDDPRFDIRLDEPSNAQVFCAGICTLEFARVLVCVELGWIGYQLGARYFTGACFDPAPFPFLQRANAVVLLLILLVVARARHDRRVQDEAHRDRVARWHARERAALDAIHAALQAEHERPRAGELVH